MDRHVSSFAHSSIPSSLLRLAAVSAIIGGALRILAAFIYYVPESPMLETLYATIDCGLLFGLAAIYWPVSERLGWSGAAGYVVATIGAASLIGPDPRMFGLEFYMVGSAIFELGLLILAIACLCRKILGATALLWVTSMTAAIIAVALGGSDIAFELAGSALGLGFVWAGFHALAATGSATEITMPVTRFNQAIIGGHDQAENVRFYETLGFRLVEDSAYNGYDRFEAPDDTTPSQD